MTSATSINSTATILQLLDISKQGQSDSDIVHAHITSMLAAQAVEQQRQHHAYNGLLSALIAHYNRQTETGSPLYQHLELLKLRAAAQPGPAELNEMQAIIADIIGINKNGRASKTAVDDNLPIQNPVATQPSEQSMRQNIDPVPATLLPLSSASLVSDEFLLLGDKHKRMEEIQAALSLHLTEVAEQNKALGKALRHEHNSINSSTNIGELKTLKAEFSNEISQLLQGHQALAEKLDSANKFMQIIENEGRNLNNELKKAHTLSLTDELTQLPNRRAFFKRIEDEVSRVQRYEYPLCLALIDLDSFKEINDRYGHPAGDEVLRTFAERALSGFRHHDLASRYGGEEFAIILPNTDVLGAQRALEKVRGRTSRCTFQVGNTTHPIPTFSAGIALYAVGDTPVSMIERADQALYRAKRMGRNRIEVIERDEKEGAMKPSSHQSS